MNQLKTMEISGIECYEKDGVAYLKLETVCKGLGFTEIAKSGNVCVKWSRVRRYLKEIGYIDTSVDKYNLPDFIPENFFYRLAMYARNETGRRFQAFVADEVLPSIRKHGGYIANQEELSDTELLAKALSVANRVLEERERKIQMLQGKADYFDQLVDRHLLTNFRTAAKEFHMEQRDFVNFLIDNKYIYRDSQKKLMPYNEHVLSGWFEVKDCKSKNNNWSGQQAFLTPKGKEALRLLLSR